MKFLPKIIFPCFILIFFLVIQTLQGQDTSQNKSSNDSLYMSLLFNHLRNNFDDIHDVSMRFHHLDHNLNGIILINMHWENGRMTSASVLKNETNNQDFGTALIQSFQKWNIKDLVGPYEINLPLNIKIVGSDDSTFSEKGIFTGEIYDINDNPLHHVQLQFQSTTNPVDTLRNCFSNREGIFVKTLIPTGKWNIVFSAKGFKNYKLKAVNIKKGDHIRKKIVLQPNGKA